MTTSTSSRWIGLSAAFAATVGAIAVAGIGATAAPADEPSVYVAVPPCRLVDTRPEFQIGPRSTPLQADETFTQQATGTNGDCTIPAGAKGVSLNVTAVGPTAPSFMTLFPAGGDVPTASNLNYLPGAAPTPNKVDVKLSDDGAIGVYNLAGTVDLIIDVSGYYSDTWIQEVMTRLDASTLITDVYTKAETYSQDEVDTALADKADLDDVYTKTETYTQDEVDTALADKADLDDVYTKAEADARYVTSDVGVVVRQATNNVRGLLGTLLYAIDGVTIGSLEDGLIELEQPPALIDPVTGVVEYELTEIQLCVDSLIGAVVDTITVSSRDELGAITDLVETDDVDAAGCRTIDLTTLPLGDAYFTELDVVGALGSLQLTSIESTWFPAVID
jgi:hypothetical protein